MNVVGTPFGLARYPCKCYPTDTKPVLFFFSKNISVFEFEL